MKQAEGLHWGARSWRLVGIAVGIAAAVLSPMGLLPWLRLLSESAAFHRGVVAILIGLEIAYSLSVAAVAAGLVIVGGLALRSRRGGQPSPAIARGLLLCVSFLASIVAVEAGTATVMAWNSRTVRPLGMTGLPTSGPLLPRFPEEPRGDEIDLVVLGESSAVGFPCREWLSIGRLVAWGLERGMPSCRVNTEILAHEGDTLEDQHLALSRLSRRPDAVIVYCGHNEFDRRFPPAREVGHYRDRAAPLAPWDIDTRLGLISPLCALIRKVADRHRVGIPPTRFDQRPLVDVPAFTEAEFAERRAGFRRRLEAIVCDCERLGAIPVLVVPPGNDADFEPNRSYLEPEARLEEREAFARAFLAVRRREEADPAGCLARYAELLARHPSFAETHFRLARLLERAGRWQEAYAHYVAARDRDGYPIRCPCALQEAYREVAREHDALMIDGQQLFHGAGEHGLLDDRLFHDAMHPSVLGHITLAQGVLRGLHARHAFGWPRDAPTPRLDPVECAAHFGLDSRAWQALCERGAMFYHGVASSRYDSSERNAKREAFRDAARKIADGTRPEAVGLPNIGIPPPSTETGMSAGRGPRRGAAGVLPASVEDDSPPSDRPNEGWFLSTEP
jgi:hypothetical protein